MSNRIKVALVDDHLLFRKGLRGILSTCDDIEVVAEASNGQEFLESESIFDVVLLDIDMPCMNGFQTAERLLEINPESKIVILSMHSEGNYYFQMVELGVKGFLLKSSTIEQVHSAITVVAEGGSYFSQELLTSLVGSLKSPAIENDHLSVRELEILLLICRGLSNSEIGDKLFISKRTVDKHRANILEKSGCKNTANLVVWAIKNKIVEI